MMRRSVPKSNSTHLSKPPPTPIQGIKRPSVAPRIPNQLRTQAVQNPLTHSAAKRPLQERSGDTWECNFAQCRPVSPTCSSCTTMSHVSGDLQSFLAQMDPLRMMRFLVQESKVKVKVKYPDDAELLNLLRQVYFLTRRLEHAAGFWGGEGVGLGEKRSSCCTVTQRREGQRMNCKVRPSFSFSLNLHSLSPSSKRGNLSKRTSLRSMQRHLKRWRSSSISWRHSMWPTKL